MADFRHPNNWTPSSPQMCIFGHPILKSWLKPWTEQLTWRLLHVCILKILSDESQEGVATTPLTTRKALTLYKVYGTSTLLVLNRYRVNPLLVFNCRYAVMNTNTCIIIIITILQKLRFLYSVTYNKLYMNYMYF